MKVMLCHDLESRRLWFPSCVSPKIDGIRAFYKPGDTFLLSRNEKPIFGMNHIIEAIRFMNCELDMELTVPGLEFNELSGLIRNHSATPEARAHIIDSPGPGYLKERRGRLVPSTDVYNVIPHYLVKSTSEVIHYNEMFLRQGYEGLVWKSFNHTYEDKRSWDWMRLVPVKSADVTVIGIYEGEGKMKGLAGGFYFRFNNQLCKCGTMLGTTYEDRAHMLDNPHLYISRTAVVEYKELQPSGKPRQPRFKGWRDDK